MEKTTRSVVWFQFVVLSMWEWEWQRQWWLLAKMMFKLEGFKFSIPDRQKTNDASMPYHSYLRA